MSLFNKLPKADRQQTQLAYKVKYWPREDMPPAAVALVTYNKLQYFYKQQIEASCNETMETLSYRGRSYKIVWAWNNVPTEQEWERKSARWLVKAEFRTSPAIPELAVVVLSF